MTDNEAYDSILQQLYSTSLEELEHLQTTIEQTLQVLGKRDIQVLIDFDSMTKSIRQGMDSAQKNSNQVLRQLMQFQELVHTSAIITSSLDLNQVLEEVMDTVIKLTGAERAYLMLRQGTTGELKVQAARNWEHETLTQESATFSSGILHSAIESRVPIVTTNAQDDSRFQGMKSVFSLDLRSIIVVPLVLQDEVIGVLYADNRIEQGVFSKDDIPLLTAFANQASIAISNARLFEKVKDDLKKAQRQVESLKIDLDQHRIQEKVQEITETEYFRLLTQKAKILRTRSELDDD
jgi:sigma-B regulation protein RsbU (phosphoserine phosphatase)